MIELPLAILLWCGVVLVLPFTLGVTIAAVAYLSKKQEFDMTKQNKKAWEDAGVPWWLDRTRAYVPANKTNVLATFKRLGWVPPSEQPKKAPNWSG